MVPFGKLSIQERFYECQVETCDSIKLLILRFGTLMQKVEKWLKYSEHISPV